MKVRCAELELSELGDLLREVRGGTLLLEEVSRLSAKAQNELVRHLGEPEGLGFGHAGASPLDVRFIATTSSDLTELAHQGAFRSELLRWLGGIRILVPTA